MHPRRATVRLLVLLIAGVALVLVGRGMAAETAPQGQGQGQGQEVQPGSNQIIVVLTCTPQRGGGIRVNPYRRRLDSTETATWRSVGNYRGEYTIEPVGFFPWALSNGGVSDENGEIIGTPPEAGAPDGVFSYVVKFMCEGDEVVLDPRMEVPR